MLSMVRCTLVRGGGNDVYRSLTKNFMDVRVGVTTGILCCEF